MVRQVTSAAADNITVSCRSLATPGLMCSVFAPTRVTLRGRTPAINDGHVPLQSTSLPVHCVWSAEMCFPSYSFVIARLLQVTFVVHGNGAAGAAQDPVRLRTKAWLLGKSVGFPEPFTAHSPRLSTSVVERGASSVCLRLTALNCGFLEGACSWNSRSRD